MEELLLQAATATCNAAVLSLILWRQQATPSANSGKHVTWYCLSLCAVNVVWSVPALVTSIVRQFVTTTTTTTTTTVCAVEGFLTTLGWLATLALCTSMSYYANRVLERAERPSGRSVLASIGAGLGLAVLLASLPVAESSWAEGSDGRCTLLSSQASVSNGVTMALVIFVFGCLCMTTLSHVRMYRYAATEHRRIGNMDEDDEEHSAGSVQLADMKQLAAYGNHIMPPLVVLSRARVFVLLGLTLWLWIGFGLVLFVSVYHLETSASDLPLAVYHAARLLAMLQSVVNPIAYSVLWLRWFT